jgi:hypothetical protein
MLLSRRRSNILNEGNAMPVSLTDFILGNVIMVAIVAGVIALNRWRSGLGWKFLIGVVVFYIAGNMIEGAWQ